MELGMLHDRLIHLRKENKKTQADVARVLGVTRPAYTAYEKGSRNPDYETLDKLADYFGVTADYLLGRSDNRKLTQEDEEFREKHNLDEGVKEVKFREMQEQLKDYSDEEVDELLQWMKFKAEQNRKKREKNQGE